MKEFLDNANRKWQLNIKLGSLRTVKDSTGVDLSTFPECAKQLSDIYLFVKVIWELIKPQAEKANLSEQDFYDSLDGECLDKAFEAFLEEMVNFSPPQKRNNLRKLIAKGLEQAERMETILSEKIDSIDLNTIIPVEPSNS